MVGLGFLVVVVVGLGLLVVVVVVGLGLLVVVVVVVVLVVVVVEVVVGAGSVEAAPPQSTFSGQSQTSSTGLKKSPSGHSLREGTPQLQ